MQPPARRQQVESDLADRRQPETNYRRAASGQAELKVTTADGWRGGGDQLIQPGALIAFEQFDHARGLRALTGRRRCWCAPGRRHICCGLRFRRTLVRVLRNGRAGYLTLIGFVGGPEDGAKLDRRIETALSSHDATDLAAMIAADLALGGRSRIEWIETRIFADKKSTMPEIEAALLALNVLGDANGAAAPRARVVEAYRDFIKLRPPMAGFVAPQLADWGRWDAGSFQWLTSRPN